MADRSIHPIDRLKEQFTLSRLFYLLILLTFSPIIIIKIYSLHAGVSPFFYSYHPGIWALLLDIYDNLVSFFWLYLLAVYLWMIFNISWMLSKISESSYYESLKIEPLDADKVGGLKPIRELILWISIYYFLIIILAAATYLVAGGLLLYESISLFIFWLVGMIFSISGWHKLRKLLSGKIQSEIASLSEIMEYKRAQLIDIITENKEKENEGQMDSLSNALDIINKERERIIQYKLKPLDAKTIILFISSSVLSLISIFETLEDAGKNTVVKFAINSTQPYLNDSINHLLQFFPK